MLRKLFSPFGRLSRGGMWLWSVFLPWIAGGALLFVDIQIAGGALVFDDSQYDFFKKSFSFSNAFNLIYLWPSMVALPVKRFHDLGLSGWVYAGLIFIVFVSVLVVAPFMLWDSVNAFPSLFEPASVFSSIAAFAQKLPAWSGAVAWVVIIIATLINFWLTLVSPGQFGDNQFGPDPFQ